MLGVKRTRRGAMLAVGVALVGLGACIPDGTVLWENTNIRGQIPGFKGEDTLLGANCISAGKANGSVLTINCHAALSNGVSDLLNDLHTVVDLVDLIGPDAEPYLLAAARDRCTAGLRAGIDRAIAMVPAGLYRDLVADYVNKQKLRDNAAWYCIGAVITMWREVDRDVYSTGHNCAVGKVNIVVRSVNEPPQVNYSSYAISEVLCPRSRLTLDIPGPFDPPVPFWGND